MHFQSTARPTTALQLYFGVLALLHKPACLANLSSLTEAEPDILSAVYIYK